MSEIASGRFVPLDDAIIVAAAQMVDDAQTGRREPSHSDIEFLVKRAGLNAGDPVSQGQIVGKAKRVRGVLSWALEHNERAGSEFLQGLLGLVRGVGGFREHSPNYVGRDSIDNAIGAFKISGYVLSSDGELRPLLLDGLSGRELTDALALIVRRAKRGSEDAGLVTGTSKDLLEAVAAHILQQRFGSYQTTANFPTLLGQVFVELRLATPHDPVQAGEPSNKRLERALYELACSINQLRNKQGTGHGRPWLPTVSSVQAKAAIESMGVISGWLLDVSRG